MMFYLSSALKSWLQITRHVFIKYLPNKTLFSYKFFLRLLTLQKFETKVEKIGRAPLNTAIPRELVKIHLTARTDSEYQFDFQSADITKLQHILTFHSGSIATHSLEPTQAYSNSNTLFRILTFCGICDLVCSYVVTMQFQNRQVYN